MNKITIFFTIKLYWQGLMAEIQTKQLAADTEEHGETARLKDENIPPITAPKLSKRSVNLGWCTVALYFRSSGMLRFLCSVAA